MKLQGFETGLRGLKINLELEREFAAHMPKDFECSEEPRDFHSEMSAEIETKRFVLGNAKAILDSELPNALAEL